MSQFRAMSPHRHAPVVSWVCVTDGAGHVRMEMRWQVGRPTRQAVPRAASAA